MTPSDSILGEALTEDLHAHITHIYERGPQSIQVVCKNHRVVRITAARVLKGLSASYSALYDEQKEHGWVVSPFPPAHGETATECLLAALKVVDAEGAPREDRWR